MSLTLKANEDGDSPPFIIASNVLLDIPDAFKLRLWEDQVRVRNIWSFE
jgi:hypothetical protein